KYVGGSCPNIACLPSKNVIHSAKVASYFRRAAEFGIAPGDWTIDMAAVRDRKRMMVNGLVEVHLPKYRESGAGLVMGSGRVGGPTGPGAGAGWGGGGRSRPPSRRAARGRCAAGQSSSTPVRGPASTIPLASRSRGR